MLANRDHCFLSHPLFPKTSSTCLMRGPILPPDWIISAPNLPSSWNRPANTQTSTEEGSESPVGLHFDEGPLPTALLPAHSGTPDSPSPGYRWPAAPTSSAATATSSGAAAKPRLPAAPMAAGAPGRDGSERAAPARGAHAPRWLPGRCWVRTSSFSTPEARGPRPRPGEALQSAPGGARGLRRYKHGGAAPTRDLGARSRALRPRPLGSPL